MGSIFRSRDMAFCEVFFQSETAFNCVAALGEVGMVQFNDMNALNQTTQKPKFLPEIRRIDEMELKLRFIESEIVKEHIEIKELTDNPPALQPRDISKLEAKLDELQGKLTEMDTDLRSMKSYQLEMIERLLALQLTAPYLTDLNLTQMHNINEPNVQPSSYRRWGATSPQSETFTMANLNFLVGVITRERVTSFERMLWRIGGNNVFVRSMIVTEDLQDPKTGSKLLLNVFIAIFEGDIIREKIETICKAFHATVYPCPEHPDERAALCEDIKPRISEMSIVLKQAADLHYQLLTTAARDIRTWKVQLRKVKSVYHTMNMLNMDVTKRYFIGHCWCPVAELKRVEDALREATKSSAGELLVPFIVNQILPSSANEVPTYIPSNKFTAGFQSIVDAFSVARYHEVNPALYTIITFPFLFSVMFSDAGHGVIVLMFALYLIFRERSLSEIAERNETFGMIFNGRYLIFLMGVFSLYSGLMFNEFFGKSVNLFQSRWHTNLTNAEINEHGDHYALSPVHGENFGIYPYPFGVDPIWNLASNQIIFTNSLKMKISVIFGVAHMFFGVVLSVFNHLYYRQYSNMVFEFIPQILLISCMFVYMDVLIVYKWLAFDATNSHEAPSILLGMINMFMFQYSNDSPAGHWVYLHLKPIQTVLVLIVAFCIPWLLLAKPLYLLRKSHEPINCRNTATGDRLVSPGDSTPMPVLSRNMLTSPMRPFIGEPGDIELGEVTRQRSTQQPITASPTTTRRSVDEASTSKRTTSPPVKFSTLFAEDTPDLRAQSPQVSVSGEPAVYPEQQQQSQQPEQLKSPVALQIPKNPSNDTIMPVSPHKGSYVGGEESAVPDIFVRQPSLSYSPFPPAPKYREKLDETISKKDDELFDFGEVLMLQMIHTIEYVLGLVSHTASYLRLWALSLAHAELSEVLWVMILRAGFVLAADSLIGYIYVAFAMLAWTVLTLAVLVMMEGMSAFLHALRLHWVEFQSKFYTGNGRPFEPFSFDRVKAR